MPQVVVTEEEGPVIITRNWFECKREGSVILKVNVTNKSTGKVKCRVRLEHVATDVPDNVNLPCSAFKEVLYKTGDVKAIVHIEKKVAYLPWTPLRVIVESVNLENPQPASNNNTERTDSKNLGSKDFTINVIEDHFNP